MSASMEHGSFTYARNGTVSDRSAGGGGKWVLHVPREHATSVWLRIKQAVETGQLERAHAAKIPTDELADTERGIPGAPVLICVYNANHLDIEEVRCVLRGLRTLRINAKLTYKENYATNADHYGSGASLYVAQHGECTFLQWREPYTADDSALDFDANGPCGRTVKRRIESFRRPIRH